MVVTVTFEPLGTLLAVTARFSPSIGYESDAVISLASGVVIERVVWKLVLDNKYTLTI